MTTLVNIDIPSRQVSHPSPTVEAESAGQNTAQVAFKAKVTAAIFDGKLTLPSVSPDHLVVGVHARELAEVDGMGFQ